MITRRVANQRQPPPRRHALPRGPRSRVLAKRMSSMPFWQGITVWAESTFPMGKPCPSMALRGTWTGLVALGVFHHPMVTTPRAATLATAAPACPLHPITPDHPAAPIPAPPATTMATVTDHHHQCPIITAATCRRRRLMFRVGSIRPVDGKRVGPVFRPRGATLFRHPCRGTVLIRTIDREALVRHPCNEKIPSPTIHYGMHPLPNPPTATPLKTDREVDTGEEVVVVEAVKCIPPCLHHRHHLMVPTILVTQVEEVVVETKVPCTTMHHRPNDDRHHHHHHATIKAQMFLQDQEEEEEEVPNRHRPPRLIMSIQPWLNNGQPSRRIMSRLPTCLATMKQRRHRRLLKALTAAAATAGCLLDKTIIILLILIPIIHPMVRMGPCHVPTRSNA